MSTINLLTRFFFGCLPSFTPRRVPYLNSPAVNIIQLHSKLILCISWDTFDLVYIRCLRCTKDVETDIIMVLEAILLSGQHI